MLTWSFDHLLLTDIARLHIAFLYIVARISCSYDQHFRDLDIALQSPPTWLPNGAGTENSCRTQVNSRQIAFELPSTKRKAAASSSAQYTSEPDLHSHVLY